MSDVPTAKLLVADTGPLITLAVAESLGFLLYPGLPVYIPDAVFYEAVRDEDAIGARGILDWIQANTGGVQILPTEVFANYIRQLDRRGPFREKDLGERAAIEIISDVLPLEADERAMLLTEDDRALRRVLVTNAELTERIIPLTTRDFLDGLEEARRIQSADEVYRAAAAGGRDPSRRRILLQQHEAAIRAVRTALSGRT